MWWENRHAPNNDYCVIGYNSENLFHDILENKGLYIYILHEISQEKWCKIFTASHGYKLLVANMT